MAVLWIEWLIAFTVASVAAMILARQVSPMEDETRLQRAVRVVLGVGSCAVWAVAVAAALWLGIRLWGE